MKQPAERVVVLVGAGATVPNGYPVTGQFLERILAGLREPHRKRGWQRWAGLKHVDGGAGNLRRLIRDVYPGLGRSTDLEGASIVDVLSLTDLVLGEQLALHPTGTHQRLREQRELLLIAMNGVLQGKRARELPILLAAWLLELAGASAASRACVVTTNYDSVLESAIYSWLLEHRIEPESVVDFGLPWRPVESAPVRQRPQDSPLGFLKLHGSLNWLRCEVCGHVVINLQKRINSLAFWKRRSRYGYNVCECRGLLRSTLVVPSTVRDIRDPNLLGVWQAALEEIRVADRLVILGYSMPAEDVTVRSLLLRALNARPRGRPLEVEVVQYEDEGTPEPAWPRFRKVFTRAQLPVDRFHVDGLEHWMMTEMRGPSIGRTENALERIRRRARTH